MNASRGRGRGQVDAVGVLLLAAFVVVSAGTFGTFYLASTVERVSPSTTTEVDVDAVHHGGTTTVTVSHRIGEPLEGGRLLVHSVGKVNEYELPDPFEAGETWATMIPGTPPGVQLRVLVVENTTERVVFDDQFAVRTPGPTATPAPAYDPSGDGGTATSTPTSTATPAPTTTPKPNDPPTVTTFEATSSGNSGKIDIDWSVSDDEGLASVDIVLSEGGTTVAQESPEVSGTSSSGGTQFANLNGGTYTVEIVVRDTGGLEASETTTVVVGSG